MPLNFFFVILLWSLYGSGTDDSTKSTQSAVSRELKYGMATQNRKADDGDPASKCDPKKQSCPPAKDPDDDKNQGDDEDEKSEDSANGEKAPAGGGGGGGGGAGGDQAQQPSTGPEGAPGAGQEPEGPSAADGKPDKSPSDLQRPEDNVIGKPDEKPGVVKVGSCKEDNKLISPICECRGCRWSSRFGWRSLLSLGKARDFHHGHDYAGPAGTPINAMYSGVVDQVHTGCIAGKTEKRRKCNGGLGNYVRVRVDKPLEIGHQTVRPPIYLHFLHLKHVYAKEGQPIAKGEMLGTLGNTGFSSGNHLDIKISRSPYRRYVKSQWPKGRNGPVYDPSLVFGGKNSEVHGNIRGKCQPCHERFQSGNSLRKKGRR